VIYKQLRAKLSFCTFPWSIISKWQVCRITQSANWDRLDWQTTSWYVGKSSAVM